MTTQQKTKPVVKTTKRPWQGTFLAVLNIIGLVVLGILIPLLLLLAIGGGILGFIDGVNPGLATLIGGGGLILSLILIVFFILGIFIVRGVFKGQKWAIIISLVFTTLGLFGLIRNFNLFTLLINGLFLYLEIACLIHPFYGGKK